MAARLLHCSDVENAYDDPERVGRLAATVRELRDGETVVCDTGDTLAPSVLSAETDGDHVRPFHEAAGVDYHAFGNHDFDLGTGTLRRAVAESPGTWLTANLRGPDGDRPFAADAGAERTAVESVGGRRIGLLGLTDPGIVREHGGADGVTAVDPVPAAGEAVADLRERGVDDVVVLSHAGTTDRRLARTLDVEAVLGGHAHDEVAATVAGTVLTRPGVRGRYVATITLGAATGAGDPRLVPVRDRPVAGDVAETYRGLLADAGLDGVVGSVDGRIDRGPAAVYPESRAGNLVVDAYRWVADADVAVCNALMLRSGPPIRGEVTAGDLRSLTPFENRIHSTTLSGAELLALFGNLPAPAAGTDGPELFAHVSGARVRYRRDGAPDLVGATVGGAPVVPDREYRVAAPSFAFYRDLFAPLSIDRPTEDHGSQHDALADYVREVGVVPRLEGRVVATFDRHPDARSL